jgi:hypothetical protein
VHHPLQPAVLLLLLRHRLLQQQAGCERHSYALLQPLLLPACLVQHQVFQLLPSVALQPYSFGH